MIIMKFGGTSVGDATAIRRVTEIVRSRLEKRPVVVVSAVAQTTDQLVHLAQAAARRDQPAIQAALGWVRELHQTLIAELGIEKDSGLSQLLDDVEERLANCADTITRVGAASRDLVDEASSVGELLSSRIVVSFFQTQGLPAVAVDARDFMVTDSQFGKARLIFPEAEPRTRSILVPLVEQGQVPVTQGFVGRSREGRTTTLGRGGSDYSATLLGAMLGVELVEIWSDVEGVMTADPRLVPEARLIRSMTFSEAAELAYFGAKVLHPATIQPAVERGIPVAVLNSMQPSDTGTVISREPETRRSQSLVKSIACKKGLTVIEVDSTRMLMAHGFMSRIFEVFNRYQTSVDLVATSEVSVSITVDNTEHLDALKDELSQFAHVEIQPHKAIVCVVGENMKRVPGMPARIFSELEDIDIHLISQGASEINISFVIDEPDVPGVVQRLHHKFFTGPLDQGIFVTSENG